MKALLGLWRRWVCAWKFEFRLELVLVMYGYLPMLWFQTVKLRFYWEDQEARHDQCE